MAFELQLIHMLTDILTNKCIYVMKIYKQKQIHHRLTRGVVKQLLNSQNSKKNIGHNIYREFNLNFMLSGKLFLLLPGIVYNGKQKEECSTSHHSILIYMHSKFLTMEIHMLFINSKKSTNLWLLCPISSPDTITTDLSI